MIDSKFKPTVKLILKTLVIDQINQWSFSHCAYYPIRSLYFHNNKNKQHRFYSFEILVHKHIDVFLILYRGFMQYMSLISDLLLAVSPLTKVAVGLH
jgi:hypothetical protein